MFRKYYKAANDDIKPNRALIDDIFERAETKTEKSAKVYKFSRRYGTAVAAVLILVVSALAYPQLSKINDTPIVKDTNQIMVRNAEISSAESVIGQGESDVSQKSENNQFAARTKSSENDMYLNNNQVEESGGPEESVTEGKATGRILELERACYYEIAVSDINEISEDEILSVDSALRERFGDRDMETGNEFIFEVVGKAVTENQNFYIGRWRWLVDDHSSLITEFALNEEKTHMYECQHTKDGMLQWNTENNLLK